MLNARLCICDALWNRYENKVCNVPITSDLFNLTGNGHKSSKLYLEEQKRIEEGKLKRNNEKKEKIRTGAEVEIVKKENFHWRYRKKN